MPTEAGRLRNDVRAFSLERALRNREWRAVVGVGLGSRCSGRSCCRAGVTRRTRRSSLAVSTPAYFSLRRDASGYSSM